RTEIFHGAADRRTVGLLAHCRKRGQTGEQRLHLCRVGGKIGRARLGDRERLAGALRLCPFDVPQILEHRQRRIDDAGAGRIGPAGQLLDGADEIVAMPGLIRDELEQDEPQLSRIEQAPTTALPIIHPASAEVPAMTMPELPVLARTEPPLMMTFITKLMTTFVTKTHVCGFLVCRRYVKIYLNISECQAWFLLVHAQLP